jgi:membrane fusion protein, heavy metal efflux system
MKQYLVALFASCTVAACNNNHTHSAEKKAELEASSYTLYTSKSELFVEFKPLVVGQTSKFAAHLTKLGENFVPYTEGTVAVSLLQNGKELTNTAGVPTSPGIFRLALQPTQPGLGKLVFNIQTAAFTDQIIIDSVEVYVDEKAAIAAQPADAASSDISYLKEQAWKVEFANAPVEKQTIHDIVKATGEILPAPGDQVTVVSRSNGIIKFTGNKNVAGAEVKEGQQMFAITGGEIPFENVAAAKQSAKAELAAAETEYGRANELIKDKLITQREFQEAKLRYENAQIAITNINRNYSTGGRSLSAPISGYVKNILVSEGQFVSSGQPLATISKNRKLVLRADVSLKDADKIKRIDGANFKILQNKSTYDIKDLNGRLLTIAKTTSVNTPYIPVHFQIDGKPGMIPGSFAEVYLKTAPINNVLAIPTSALIEEQGMIYAYVQTEGESFQKRELKLGANDGEKVQVLLGLTEGERVVTRGAYQIKLSQASGTLPAHGHEH